MKKALIIALILLPLSLSASVIDIDGSFADWDVIDAGVADDEDIAGAWYYYENDAWGLACVGECESVNQEQQLDIIEFKITNIEDYLYLYYQTAEPLGAVKTTSDAYVSREDYGVPQAYNHWQIIGFDATADDEYDYYYAINIFWDASGNGFPDSDPAIYLYEDNGDGEFTFDVNDSPEETLLAVLADADFDWAIDTASYVPKMELQVDLTQFLEETGVSRDADLTIKLASDENLGETTDAFSYNIQEAQDNNEQYAGLSVSGLKATSVTLEWQAVENASQYQAQLRLSDDTFVDNYYSVNLEQALSGISSNTEYKFRVRAEVGGAWQDWSDYYAFQTLPDRPANVKISNKRADKITVSWDASAGTITQYQVNLYNLKYKVLQTALTQDTSVVFSNLKPYKRYRIKIRAYNDDMESRYSKIKRFKTAKKKFYVKIKDLTTSNLSYNTPGADIDAVILVRNNYHVFYAEEAVRSKVLVGTGDRGNDCDNPNAAIGSPDKTFVSLGGRGGFIVLKFERALNYRARTLTVKELGGSNGGFAEPYQVYIGATSRGPWKSISTGSGETEFNL